MQKGSDLEHRVAALAVLAGCSAAVAAAPTRDAKLAVLAEALALKSPGPTIEAQLEQLEQLAHERVQHDSEGPAQLEQLEGLEHPPAAEISNGEALHLALEQLGTIDTRGAKVPRSSRPKKALTRVKAKAKRARKVKP